MDNEIKLNNWDEVNKFIGDTYFSASTVTNIMRAQSEHGADFSDALSKGQLASKAWLISEFFRLTKLYYGFRVNLRVCIVGGWYGTLAAMLNDNEHKYDIYGLTIDSIDLSPVCAPIANLVNYREYIGKRFNAITANMYDFDYTNYDIIINTCCEHIPNLPDWINSLPANTHLILQTNDFLEGDGHINCVNNLSEFESNANLGNNFYKGTLVLPNYSRFMLVGERDR